MSEFKVLKCEHCGKTAIVLANDGCPTICCGEAMKELVPGAVDAALEKHVPAVSRENDGSLSVQIGSVEHPMTEEHYIVWIALVSDTGFRIEYLKPGDKPEVRFQAAEKARAVYAYCNLHGLWKKEL
jgi:superoxide reductase